MYKFAAMTAVSILATPIATMNPSFEADARADGKSKNSFAGGGVASHDGNGHGNMNGIFNW